MAFSIPPLADDSKFSHALRFAVLEQVCPRDLVSDLLPKCHAWGKRERSLNQLVVVYYVIALALFRRLNLAESWVTWRAGCVGCGRTRVCPCRLQQHWCIVVDNWAPR